MGIRMKEIYTRVEELGGLAAKIKFAKITLMSSQDAELMPDTPENIEKLEKAFLKVEAVFKDQTNRIKIK